MHIFKSLFVIITLTVYNITVLVSNIRIVIVLFSKTFIERLIELIMSLFCSASLYWSTIFLIYPCLHLVCVCINVSLSGSNYIL